MRDGGASDGRATLDRDALSRLAGYLGRHLAEPPHGPLTATVLTGGRSNLSFVVSDGARQWVLRRPPLGALAPTAHDMTREHRMLAALAGSPVPVPRVDALCEDDAVVGAPFVLMEHVGGRVWRAPADAGDATPERRLVLTHETLRSANAKRDAFSTSCAVFANGWLGSAMRLYENSTSSALKSRVGLNLSVLWNFTPWRRWKV